MNSFRIRPLLGIAAAILLLAVVVTEPVQAQQGTVAGQVTDKSNQQPVAGAQVLVSGTNLQARTSREGRYTITRVPAGSYTVQVRFIGYATGTSSVSVAPGQTASVDFALTPAAVPLEAIVVSATGEEQVKRELGNTVGTIDAAKITQLAAPNNTADLLNSRIPGVEVMQSGGTTGTGSRIRIRGATSLSLRNEPIIVVDGVRIDNSPQAGSLENFTGGQAPSRLNDLNNDDIESVEVVKGPSAAALYGTDAANGVIQIRTKRGRPGPTKWTAYAEGGALNDKGDWPANYFSRQANDSSCRLSSQARGICTIVGVDSFNPIVQNSPFRTGVHQEYGLTASGGNEVTTFFVSGAFERQRGVFQSNDLRKTNVRVNLTNQVSRLMDISANVGYVSSLLNLPQNDNNDQGIVASGLLGYAFDTVAPTGNPGNPQAPALQGGYRFLTPPQAFRISVVQRVERFTGGLNVNFRPATFLTMFGTAGYDLTNQNDNQLTPPGEIPLDQNRLDGNATANRAQLFSYTASFNTKASFRLSSNVNSNTTVGVQYYKNVFQQVQASGRKVVAGTGGLGGVVVPSVGDTTAPFVTLGGYIEELVAVRDRLYFTGAVRADKNSAFGTNFGNILYPKLSGSWVVSEEPFFPRPTWLNSLRVRAAWGKSGRAPGTLDALHFYHPVAVAQSGSDVPAVTIGGAGNNNLKPEQTRELETGFDVDVINQRVHFEATYYNKRSKDGLIAVQIAPSVGESFTRFDNLGEVGNQGYELLLTAQLLRRPDLQWSVTASAWGNKNRVLKTDSIGTPIIFGLGGATQRNQVGYPAGGYWGTPYTFADTSGDGLIKASELTVGDSDTFQGSSVPTHGASLSTEVNFLKHFTVFAQFDGRWGNKLDNSTESFRCIFGICAGARVPGSSLADQAAALTAPSFETGFFQDGGFVKLREVSLTYTAPPAWAARFGASSLSITATGRNLVTWTKYRGPDPEVNDIGQFNFSVADFLTQPPVRQFFGRINVTF